MNLIHLPLLDGPNAASTGEPPLRVMALHALRRAHPILYLPLLAAHLSEAVRR